MGYDITVVLYPGFTETCLIMLISLAFSVHRIPQDVIHSSVKPQRLWPIIKHKTRNRIDFFLFFFFDKHSPEIEKPTLKYGSKKKNVVVQYTSVSNERLISAFQSLQIKWGVCIRAFAHFLYKNYRCSPQGRNITFFKRHYLKNKAWGN